MKNNSRLGPIDGIAADFQSGSDFVNFIHNDGSFCDIARFIGDAETINSVFCHSQAVICNPFLTVKIFNNAVRCKSCQNNIFVGPFSRIAADREN